MLGEGQKLHKHFISDQMRTSEGNLSVPSYQHAVCATAQALGAHHMTDQSEGA